MSQRYREMNESDRFSKAGLAFREQLAEVLLEILKNDTEIRPGMTKREIKELLGEPPIRGLGRDELVFLGHRLSRFIVLNFKNDGYVDFDLETITDIE
jgi:hypothetical protein